MQLSGLNNYQGYCDTAIINFCLATPEPRRNDDPFQARPRRSKKRASPQQCQIMRHQNVARDF